MTELDKELQLCRLCFGDISYSKRPLFYKAVIYGDVVINPVCDHCIKVVTEYAKEIKND